MRLISLLALVALACSAQTGERSASANFTVDLAGTPDTRDSTWGTAGAQTWTVQFSPPAGYRVRVLRLRGDLIVWPRVMPGEATVAQGQYAGALLAFATTAPEGSSVCSPCADNTMLYIQTATNGAAVRAPFDADVRAGGLLEADNKLIVKVASFLNTFGRPLHIEPTFTVVYRFEK